MGHHFARMEECLVRGARAAGVVIGLTLLLGGSPTWAALGLGAGSVTEDQMKLGGELSEVPGSRFTVHEIRTKSCLVREYVGPDGSVFGVSWRGVAAPDLAQLLGPHFSEYQLATPSVRRRRSMRVQTGSLVMEQRGHVRDIRGRAFLPNALPPAVSEEEVR